VVLQIGQVIHHDRYRIEALLGQGGMGAVYKAYDSSLHMDVAIKENFETTFEAQRQFEREANILAHLSHPNLPRVTDYFFIPNQGQYLVMDYVAGEDLQSMTRRLVRLPEPEVLTWIGQIAEALAYLHSQNPPIIHRDIKPSNIRIRPDGRAMLVDFGIAKIYDAHLATTIGAKAVTPGYSPPEQYGGGSTDTRSDIYALGATIFHLLTGQTPPDSLSRAVNSAMLTPPRQVNPEISPQMEQVVLKAVEIPTERRYQNVSELSSALLSTKSASSTAAGAPGKEKPPESSATKVVEPEKIIPASVAGMAVAQTVAVPSAGEAAGTASPSSSPESTYATQTVVVPSPGSAQAGYAAPPPATLKAPVEAGSPDGQRIKTPTWLMIAGGLAAACLLFSVFGAGIFGALRARLIARLNPSEDTPVTNAAGTGVPILAVNLTDTDTPSITSTRKSTNYSATMTQIGATRIASTTQAQKHLPRIVAQGDVPCWKMALEDHAGDEIILTLSDGQEALIQYKQQTREDETQPWQVKYLFVETGNGCTCWVDAPDVKILGDFFLVKDVLELGFMGALMSGFCP